MVPYKVEVNGNVEGPDKLPMKVPLMPISLIVPKPQLAFLTVQDELGGVKVVVVVVVLVVHPVRGKVRQVELVPL